jgi:hypothetical protein
MIFFNSQINKKSWKTTLGFALFLLLKFLFLLKNYTNWYLFHREVDLLSERNFLLW